jgi:hypothetical protein
VNDVVVELEHSRIASSGVPVESTPPAGRVSRRVPTGFDISMGLWSDASRNSLECSHRSADRRTPLGHAMAQPEPRRPCSTTVDSALRRNARGGASGRDRDDDDRRDARRPAAIRATASRAWGFCAKVLQNDPREIRARLRRLERISDLDVMAPRARAHGRAGAAVGRGGQWRGRAGADVSTRGHVRPGTAAGGESLHAANGHAAAPEPDTG